MDQVVETMLAIAERQLCQHGKDKTKNCGRCTRVLAAMNRRAMKASTDVDEQMTMLPNYVARTLAMYRFRVAEKSLNVADRAKLKNNQYTLRDASWRKALEDATPL